MSELTNTKCKTCEFFEQAFPHNRQLGICKRLIVDYSEETMSIFPKFYKWKPGMPAPRVMDDFGCVYHSPNNKCLINHSKLGAGLKCPGCGMVAKDFTGLPANPFDAKEWI